MSTIMMMRKRGKNDEQPVLTKESRSELEGSGNLAS